MSMRVQIDDFIVDDTLVSIEVDTTVTEDTWYLLLPKIQQEILQNILDKLEGQYPKKVINHRLISSVQPSVRKVRSFIVR
jgi:hypothetical protein